MEENNKPVSCNICKNNTLFPTIIRERGNHDWEHWKALNKLGWIIIEWRDRWFLSCEICKNRNEILFYCKNCKIYICNNCK